MADTNKPHPLGGATALVLFMTESEDLLAAIVPTTSALAVRACRFYDLPAGGDDADDDYAFVENWFVESTTKAEVCPMGALTGKDYDPIVAIYKVGC